MVKARKSVFGNLRQSLHRAYHARGSLNSNLWVVYSVKKDMDLVLTSDRELVHWLCYLETDNSVVDFEIQPEKHVLQTPDGAIATIPDAYVFKRDNSIEWHEVKPGKGNKAALTLTPQLSTQQALAQSHGAIHRLINDEDLEPRANEAKNWLSALAYASAIRNLEPGPERTFLTNFLRSTGSHNLGYLLNHSGGMEPAIIIGELVRMAIQGKVAIDLRHRSFGYQSRWQCHGYAQ
jgi:hypothetical protein